jgi:hypothetical protein
MKRFFCILIMVCLWVKAFSQTDPAESTGLFPHQQIPHCVWLDSNCKLIAVTHSKEVNAANITAWLSGKPISFALKQDDQLLHQQMHADLQQYFKVAEVAEEQRMDCYLLVKIASSSKPTRTRITKKEQPPANIQSIAGLCSYLQQLSGLPVLDETGLPLQPKPSFSIHLPSFDELAVQEILQKQGLQLKKTQRSLPVARLKAIY